MKEKLVKPTAIVARRKARGTRLPVMPAANEPLRAMAAVGAMIPMESAMASKKESSRRSLPACCSIDCLRVFRPIGAIIQQYALVEGDVEILKMTFTVPYVLERLEYKSL